MSDAGQDEGSNKGDAAQAKLASQGVVCDHGCCAYASFKEGCPSGQHPAMYLVILQERKRRAAQARQAPGSRRPFSDPCLQVQVWCSLSGLAGIQPAADAAPHASHVKLAIALNSTG